MAEASRHCLQASATQNIKRCAWQKKRLIFFVYPTSTVEKVFLEYPETMKTVKAVTENGNVPFSRNY